MSRHAYFVFQIGKYWVYSKAYFVQSLRHDLILDMFDIVNVVLYLHIKQANIFSETLFTNSSSHLGVYWSRFRYLIKTFESKTSFLLVFIWPRIFIMLYLHFLMFLLFFLHLSSPHQCTDEDSHIIETSQYYLTSFLIKFNVTD